MMTFDQLKKAAGVRAKNTGMGIGKAIAGAAKGAAVGMAAGMAAREAAKAAKKAVPKVKKVQAAPPKPTIKGSIDDYAKRIAAVNAEIEKQNRY